MSDRLLRTRDVAERLDVSCETVLRWHRSGKLPGGYRLGSNVLRFRESEVIGWLEAQRSPHSGTSSSTSVSIVSGIATSTGEETQ